MHNKNEIRDIKARRDEFQKNTIIETQEECLTLLRLVVQYNIYHREQMMSGRGWKKGDHPTGIDEQIRLTMSRLKLNEARLRDDDLKEQQLAPLVGRSALLAAFGASDRTHPPATTPHPADREGGHVP